MKKSIITLLLFAFIGVFTGCSEDDSIAVDPSSKPESINALRKVEMKDNLKFGETSILGVVISNHSIGNFQNGILAVQQEGQPAGILLELTNAGSYEMGQEVIINLDGSTLHLVDGELRVKNLSAVNVSTTGKRVALNPRSTDISTLTAEAKYWGPILVQLENIVFDSESPIIGGENAIKDGISSATLKVLSSAEFYNEKAPSRLDAITGVARLFNESIHIYPRTMDDLKLSVTEIKEDFEDDTNTSYDVKVLNLKTGAWILDGGITASTAADLKNGSQSIRLQGSTTNENRKGILSMEFDVEGVKGVRLSHGIYPASAEVSNPNPTTIDLEISHDGGETYTFVSSFTIDVNSDVLITEEVAIDNENGEAVRFRIVNSSAPFENNNLPRISIDDVIFIL